MQYMGGKAHIAKRLIKAILNDTAERGMWYEPFVGGGNVLEAAAPYFDTVQASDIHEDLILMWQEGMDGWTPPSFVSREEYETLRNATPSANRGYAGFGASFGGKWFGGYGITKIDKKHPNAEICRSSYKTVSRQLNIFIENDIEFYHADFNDIGLPPNCVVYCDPPYRNTMPYSTGSFRYSLFYSKIREWANSGCIVYVSEMQLPDFLHTRTVWESSKRNFMDASGNSSLRIEKLFRILPE
jgi:DNA adenine methylase